MTATWPVFNLQTGRPAERVSVRRAIRDRLPFSARFARQADARPLREYIVTVRNGCDLERRILQMLWDQTRFGTLPMTYAHPEDGTVTVVFDDTELAWRKDSAVSTGFRVTLQEVIGA